VGVDLPRATRASCTRPPSSLARVPELPEVESVRRQLEPALTGQRVTRVWWDDHPAARLSGLELLAGQRVLGVERRGKYLRCTLDGPGADAVELILHLGMTGWLRLAPPEAPRDRHDRLVLALDRGRELRFRDPRRFGRASVVPAGDYRTIPTLARLGPEPLTDDFDLAGFARALGRSHAPVKALLLDQRLVAGVGNIYADESLWRARIHPASRRVGPDRARRLRTAIRAVLAEAIEREGTTFRDYRMVNGESGRFASELAVYGRAGQPCQACGIALRRTVVGQRTTVHCPRCQRA
jgi:formamidopyrimidine-DNA glycosylase